MQDWRQVRTWTREEMMKRVARFGELRGSDGGLPDSEATTSPVGDDASSMAAIKIAEGFNLGYCRAKPGKGPLMHNPDTNETFIAMTGRWRCEWNEGSKMEYVDLEP